MDMKKLKAGIEAYHRREEQKQREIKALIDSSISMTPAELRKYARKRGFKGDIIIK